MSWDDKSFMRAGFRVRHKYKRRRGCHNLCILCGAKRRSTTSGREYLPANEKQWTSNNPPCVKRALETP